MGVELTRINVIRVGLGPHTSCSRCTCVAAAVCRVLLTAGGPMSSVAGCSPASCHVCHSLLLRRSVAPVSAGARVGPVQGDVDICISGVLSWERC